MGMGRCYRCQFKSQPRLTLSELDALTDIERIHPGGCPKSAQQLNCMRKKREKSEMLVGAMLANSQVIRGGHKAIKTGRRRLRRSEGTEAMPPPSGALQVLISRQAISDMASPVNTGWSLTKPSTNTGTATNTIGLRR